MPKGTYRPTDNRTAVPSTEQVSIYDALMASQSPTDSALKRVGEGARVPANRPKANADPSVVPQAVADVAQNGVAQRMAELEGAMRGTDVTIDDVMQFMNNFGPDDDVHGMTAEEIVDEALAAKVQMMMQQDGYTSRNY
jgi:hypothetical protein